MRFGMAKVFGNMEFHATCCKELGVREEDLFYPPMLTLGKNVLSK